MIINYVGEYAMMYYIWCNERGQWWLPNRRGYTYYIREAGQYGYDGAESICREAAIGWNGVGHPPEVMFPVSCMRDR